MQIYIKLYKSIFETQPYYQGSVISDVDIIQDITSFDTASFRMELIEDIKSLDKIEIFEVVNGIDIKKFSGFIYDLKPIRGAFGLQDIYCRSENAIFYDRKVLGSQVHTNKTVQHIITSLVGPYNSLGENWQVVCDYETPTDLSAKQKDTYFDIIEELCKGLNLYRKIDFGTIYISQNIGIDRSIGGVNYQEVYYNDKQPSDSNIYNVKSVETAKRSNVLIATDVTGDTTIVDTSRVVDGVVYGVAVEDFRVQAGTPAFNEKVSQFLDTSDRRKFLHNFSIKDNSVIANTGDIVKLIIENTNTTFDINGNAMVIKKAIKYSNGGKIENFTIGDLYSTPVEFNDWFLNAEKKIRQLQIKV